MVNNDDHRELTPREGELLELVANDGLTNEEIAEKTFISPNTVRSHMSNLHTKTRTHNRAQLVAWTWRNGYIFVINGERRIFLGEAARQRVLTEARA